MSGGDGGRLRALGACLWLLLVATSVGVVLATGKTFVPRKRGLGREWAKPDWSYYHTKEQVLKEVADIVARTSEYMQLEMVTREQAGYTATLQVVSVALVPPPSDANEPGQGDEKVRALLNFGQHGREHITCEVALSFLRQLSEALLARDAWVMTLLSEAELKIIPMENVNGRLKVEHGDLCERKNGRGVDTNRNWEVDFGRKEKDYDPYEEFPGEYPFSEPEAAIIKHVAETFRPTLWVNVHSGMHALFLPFDHRAEIPKVHNAQIMLDILNHIKSQVCPICQVGSGGQTVGYLAHGTTTDYFHVKLGTPLTFTWEIYGDLHANYRDCFRMFNPLSREIYEETVSSWTRALYLAVNQTIARKSDIVYINPQTYQAGLSSDDSLHASDSGSTGAKLRGHPGLRNVSRAHPSTSSLSVPLVRPAGSSHQSHRQNAFHNTIQRQVDLRKPFSKAVHHQKEPRLMHTLRAHGAKAVSTVDHPTTGLVLMGLPSAVAIVMLGLICWWRLRRCLRMMRSKRTRTL